jgi:hypothetical protein
MANDNIKELLDEFHYHEAIDRLSIVMSMCDMYLLQHPAIKIESNVKQRVDAAVEQLYLAYQDICNVSDKRFNNE